MSPCGNYLCATEGCHGGCLEPYPGSVPLRVVDGFAVREKIWRIRDLLGDPRKGVGVPVPIELPRREICGELEDGA
jgi:hypothetical protein